MGYMFAVVQLEGRGSWKAPATLLTAPADTFHPLARQAPRRWQGFEFSDGSLGHRDALAVTRLPIMIVGNPGSQEFIHCKAYLFYCGCPRPDRAILAPGPDLDTEGHYGRPTKEKPRA